MPGTIFYTATPVNTTKIVQFENPNARGTFLDGVRNGATGQYELTAAAAAGVYSGLKARLKGSNPVIEHTLVESVTVTGDTGGTEIPLPVVSTAINSFLSRLNSAGTTVSTGQKNAFTKYINTLSTKGVYERITDLWPAVGVNQASQVLGVKNLLNLIPSGTVDYGTTGFMPTGVNAYLNTNCDPVLYDLSADNFHFSFYSRTEGIHNELMGVYASANSIMRMLVNEESSGYGIADLGSINQRITFPTPSTVGVFTATRTSPNAAAVYHDAAFVAGSTETNTGTAPGGEARRVFLCALNLNGTPIAVSNARCAGASIGVGLSAQQVADYATAQKIFRQEWESAAMPNVVVATGLRARLLDNAGTRRGSDLLTPSMAFGPKAVLEGTVIDYGNGDLRLFHTVLNNDNLIDALGIARATSVEAGFVEDSQPVLGRGFGGVARNVHGSSLVWDGTTTHLWATNGYAQDDSRGLDRNIYYYTSTDKGQTWTDHGICLNKNQPSFPEIRGFGNSGVCATQVNGKYVAVMDAMTAPDNTWKAYRCQADQLAGPWTITHRLDGELNVVQNALSGGATLFQANGLLHILEHVGTEYSAPYYGNLPTSGAYSNSSDGGITWKTPEVFWPLEDSQPYPFPECDQIADVSMFEAGGKTYVFATIGNNLSPLDNKIIYKVFNGTKEQLVSGL